MECKSCVRLNVFAIARSNARLSFLNYDIQVIIALCMEQSVTYLISAVQLAINYGIRSTCKEIHSLRAQESHHFPVPLLQSRPSSFSHLFCRSYFQILFSVGMRLSPTRSPIKVMSHQIVTYVDGEGTDNLLGKLLSQRGTDVCQCKFITN